MKPWQLYKMPRPKSEASKGKLSLVDYEIYSGIEAPETFFVRLDGWKFHGMTKKLKLKEPFDKRFAKIMIKTAEPFFKIFDPSLAYIFSDEINLLFIKANMFRRIEKIDSIFAGIASSTFSLLSREKAVFDCRVIPLEKEKILQYLIWRQAEAFRNFYNAYARAFFMEKEKLSARAAAKKLSGTKIAGLKVIVSKYARKFPAWQQNGIILYKEEYEKKGYDPIKKKEVLVKRKRLKEESKIIFASQEGKKFLEKMLDSDKNERKLASSSFEDR